MRLTHMHTVLRTATERINPGAGGQNDTKVPSHSQAVTPKQSQGKRRWGRSGCGEGARLPTLCAEGLTARADPAHTPGEAAGQHVAAHAPRRPVHAAQTLWGDGAPHAVLRRPSRATVQQPQTDM